MDSAYGSDASDEGADDGDDRSWNRATPKSATFTT